MEDIHDALIIGDNNYFADDVEIEMIADEKIEGIIRFITTTDFVNDVKKPFYYKYNNVVIEEKYLNLFNKVKYYFEDKNFNLVIILEANYPIEDSDILISLLENKMFKSKIVEKEDHTFIVVER